MTVRGPEPPAVEQSIGDKVHRPQLVRPGRRGLPFPVGGADATTRTLETQVKPFFAIEAIDPLVIDQPALTPQQDVDPEIAIAHPRLGQIADAQP
jgi:hypothetical protein